MGNSEVTCGAFWKSYGFCLVLSIGCIFLLSNPQTEFVEMLMMMHLYIIMLFMMIIIPCFFAFMVLVMPFFAIFSVYIAFQVSPKSCQPMFIERFNKTITDGYMPSNFTTIGEEQMMYCLRQSITPTIVSLVYILETFFIFRAIYSEIKEAKSDEGIKP